MLGGAAASIAGGVAPALNDAVEFCLIERLGQVIVHAHGQAALAVSVERVRRQRDDRCRSG